MGEMWPNVPALSDFLNMGEWVGVGGHWVQGKEIQGLALDILGRALEGPFMFLQDADQQAVF